jgi:hypothetical protein
MSAAAPGQLRHGSLSMMETFGQRLYVHRPALVRLPAPARAGTLTAMEHDMEDA